MNTNRAPLIAGIFLVIFTVSCVWLVFQYVSSEQERDLKNWQERLGVIAESQKRSVDDWVQKQLEQVQVLANNPLVQINLAEENNSKDESSAVTRLGQLSHMRNLLNATARISGVFTPLSSISNNSKHSINDGLALFNKQGVFLATRYFPVDDEVVMLTAKRALIEKRSIVSNIFRNTLDQPRFVIAVPVRSVQSIGLADIEGTVVAVINPQKDLYKMLTRHWLTTLSDETILAVKTETGASTMSPLAKGYALFEQYSKDDERAIFYATRNIGSFGLKKDYKNNDVLVTSRKVKNTQWLLVQKINTDEALQESTSHRKFILTILLLAVFFVVVSFIAIWRHSTSIRLQKTMDRLTARTALLNAVGDSIKDHLFLLDSDNKLVLINQALASFLGVASDDVRGKALNHLYDADISKSLLDVRQEGSGDVRNHEMRLDVNGKRYDYHLTVVALSSGNYSRSHLYALHDITDLKDAQYKHNRLLEAIIQTVVRLIDVHDPHCAHHSERTRKVAVAIAGSMKVERQRLNTLAMASQLANIGKLYVPTEILTSVGPLTPEESEELHKSTQYSVEILQGLVFEGPVIEIVKQKNECIDGSGYPTGIAGDEILLESRILAVANAFVAMTSARAYRPGLAIDQALEVIFNQVDKHYDRQVVAALIYVAENRPEWLDWHQDTE